MPACTCMGGYHCCEPPSWPWLQRRVEKRSSVIATAHEDSHMSPRGRPYKKARWSSKQKWAAEDGEDIGQIISWASKKPDREDIGQIISLASGPPTTPTTPPPMPPPAHAPPPTHTPTRGPNVTVAVKIDAPAGACECCAMGFKLGSINTDVWGPQILEFFRELPLAMWPNHIRTNRKSGNHCYIVTALCGSRVEVDFTRYRLRAEKSCKGDEFFKSKGLNSRNFLRKNYDSATAMTTACLQVLCPCEDKNFCTK